MSTTGKSGKNELGEVDDPEAGGGPGGRVAELEEAPRAGGRDDGGSPGGGRCDLPLPDPGRRRVVPDVEGPAVPAAEVGPLHLPEGAPDGAAKDLARLLPLSEGPGEVARVVVPDRSGPRARRRIGEAGDDAGLEDEGGVVDAPVCDPCGVLPEGVPFREEGRKVPAEHEQAGSAGEDDPPGIRGPEAADVLRGGAERRFPIPRDEGGEAAAGG